MLAFLSVLRGTASVAHMGGGTELPLGYRNSIADTALKGQSNVWVGLLLTDSRIFMPWLHQGHFSL